MLAFPSLVICNQNGILDSKTGNKIKYPAISVEAILAIALAVIGTLGAVSVLPLSAAASYAMLGAGIAWTVGVLVSIALSIAVKDEPS